MFLKAAGNPISVTLQSISSAFANCVTSRHTRSPLPRLTETSLNSPERNGVGTFESLLVPNVTHALTLLTVPTPRRANPLIGRIDIMGHLWPTETPNCTVGKVRPQTPTCSHRRGRMDSCQDGTAQFLAVQLSKVCSEYMGHGIAHESKCCLSFPQSNRANSFTFFITLLWR